MESTKDMSWPKICVDLIYLSGGNNVREIDGQLETNYVAQIVAAPLMSAAAYFLEQGVFTGEPM